MRGVCGAIRRPSPSRSLGDDLADVNDCRCAAIVVVALRGPPKYIRLPSSLRFRTPMRLRDRWDLGFQGFSSRYR